MAEISVVNDSEHHFRLDWNKPRSDIVMFRNDLSPQAVLSQVSCANAALSDT